VTAIPCPIGIVADGGSIPLILRQHYAFTFTWKIDARRLAEAEALDPTGQLLGTEQLGDLDRTTFEDWGQDLRKTVKRSVPRGWESWIVFPPIQIE